MFQSLAASAAVQDGAASDLPTTSVVQHKEQQETSVSRFTGKSCSGGWIPSGYFGDSVVVSCGWVFWSKGQSFGGYVLVDDDALRDT